MVLPACEVFALLAYAFGVYEPTDAGLDGTIVSIVELLVDCLTRHTFKTGNIARA